MARLTTEQIKLNIDDKESTLTKVFNSTIERLEKKVDALVIENVTLKKEVATLMTEVSELKGAAQFQSDIDDKVSKELQESTNVKAINNKNVELEEKLAELEDRNRRNNIRICGLDESDTDETWEQTEVVVKKLLDEELEIKDVSIERVHRNGQKRRTENRSYVPRSITMKLLNFKDKTKILDKFREKELWLKKIYFNEDFSQRTAVIRKELFKEVKKLKERGIKAKVIYNKLVTSKNDKANISGFSETNF